LYFLTNLVTHIINENKGKERRISFYFDDFFGGLLEFRFCLGNKGNGYYFKE